jgi:hypothetical protein
MNRSRHTQQRRRKEFAAASSPLFIHAAFFRTSATNSFKIGPSRPLASPLLNSFRTKAWHLLVQKSPLRLGRSTWDLKIRKVFPQSTHWPKDVTWLLPPASWNLTKLQYSPAFAISFFGKLYRLLAPSLRLFGKPCFTILKSLS